MCANKFPCVYQKPKSKIIERWWNCFNETPTELNAEREKKHLFRTLEMLYNKRHSFFVYATMQITCRERRKHLRALTKINISESHCNFSWTKATTTNNRDKKKSSFFFSSTKTIFILLLYRCVISVLDERNNNRKKHATFVRIDWKKH